MSENNNDYYVQEAIKLMKETIINAVKENNEIDLVPHSIKNQINVDSTEHFFAFEKVFPILGPDSIEKPIHIIVNVGYEQGVCDVIVEDENNELASLKIEDDSEILNDLKNVLLENMCVEKNAKLYTFPSWAIAYLDDAMATPEEQKLFEKTFYRLSTYEEFQKWIDSNPWTKEKMFKLRDDSVPAIWTNAIASLHGILEYEINREELVPEEEIQDKLKERKALYCEVINLLNAKDLTQLGNAYIVDDIYDSKYVYRYDKNSSITRWKDNEFVLYYKD